MDKPLPGDGFFGWLGRQVGHVRRAVKMKIQPEVVWRKEDRQQADHPDAPNVKLRRTVIDEVIVDKNKNLEK